ncbi:uncharacterized protein LOC116303646 [Actinia tenebrosa]|uniref:Uncharacterized protein LOC116303646 n=1 Tax=Actinia tenebrosa TaxID=6105 RepID=A0A6P8IRT8_ACTTE|nr:uncharacterized protein LOC116303646 [Actinia tenebrosa]
MDRGRGRRHLMKEPLLPSGTNTFIETIVEESFPDDFENYFDAENGQFDPIHTITTSSTQHADFTTSTSSASSGSFIGSSISDNSTSEHPTMLQATQSFPRSGRYQQKFLDSGSSNSFHSSGSLHDCVTFSNHVSQNCLQDEISASFPLQSTGPGFLSDRSSYNNACMGSAGVLSDFSTTSEEDNDPLNIEPTIPLDPNFDVHDYLHSLQVEFIQIKDRIFEKQQSRKDKKARQRIVDGKVKISVNSDKPIAELRVWVRREPQAATLCNDKNGDVELKKPTLLRHTHNQWLYVVDLDSVYQGKERPVYELAKVEMNERNMFEILAQVVFKNGDVSEKITSKPFLIRTLKRTLQDDVPQVQSVSTKRPHTWHPGGIPSKSIKYSPRRYVENEPDSSASPVGSSTSTSTTSTNAAIEKLVVDHLEAQRANIEHLTFGYMLQTNRGDIAYHIRLTDQAQDLKLTEGVVVGFFPSDGKTKIEPLCSENIKDAVMAGVISRSAYIEAEVPSENDKNYGKTDAVCVIGMIGVQVEGSVRTGERIYTSSSKRGVAIPESHLPLGGVIVHDNTLLGMAMEPRTPKGPEDLNVVKCFVCIVLGIGTKQMAREVETILDGMESNLKLQVINSSKRTWRRIYCLGTLALLFLALVGFLLYQYLASGTMYWYWRCERGGLPNHYLKYTFLDEGKSVEVNGVEFTYDGINKKLSEFFEKREIKHFFNRTNGVRFFLNLDRCAYGGEQGGGFLRKTVKGGLVLVVGCHCEAPVYKFKDEIWCAYRCAMIRGNLTCNPTSCPSKSPLHWPPQPSEYCFAYKDRWNVTKEGCRIEKPNSSIAVISVPLLLFSCLFFLTSYWFISY